MAHAAPSKAFSGAQKAAVILIALGGRQGAKVLQSLSPEELKLIIRGAAGIGAIEQRDLELLINDFAESFARSTGLVGDESQVQALLESAFPDGLLDSMLAGPRLIPQEPVWGKFGPGSENSLAPRLTDEHPQTAAFIISKLPNALGARVLALLPRDFRAAIAARLLKLSAVAAGPAAIVEDVLRASLQTAVDPGQARAARGRVAALINELDKADADALLGQLSEALPEDARLLQAMMFSFDDIVRLDLKSRAALFDKVGTQLIVPALRGADGAMRDAVLSALGQRARRMAEAELAQSGEPGPETIPARRAIAQAALALAEAGSITLPVDAPQP